MWRTRIRGMVTELLSGLVIVVDPKNSHTVRSADVGNFPPLTGVS